MFGLTARRRDRDMRQRRVRRRAVPMALAGFNMHDITHGDFALFSLRRRETFARRDDENLIAVVHMPAGSRTDAEVDHVAAEISDCPSPITACRVRLTAPPVQPAIGVAVSMGVSFSSLILSTRIVDLLSWPSMIPNSRRGVLHTPFFAPPQLHLSRQRGQGHSGVVVIAFGNNDYGSVGTFCCRRL